MNACGACGLFHGERDQDCDLWPGHDIDPMTGALAFAREMWSDDAYPEWPDFVHVKCADGVLAIISHGFSGNDGFEVGIYPRSWADDGDGEMLAWHEKLDLFGVAAVIDGWRNGDPIRRAIAAYETIARANRPDWVQYLADAWQDGVGEIAGEVEQVATIDLQVTVDFDALCDAVGEWLTAQTVAAHR